MAKKIYKGDRVKVDATKQQLANAEYVDPETAHYLRLFIGKTGQVFDVTTTSTGFINYHVNFGKEIGIFYSDEVTLID